MDIKTLTFKCLHQFSDFQSVFLFSSIWMRLKVLHLQGLANMMGNAEGILGFSDTTFLSHKPFFCTSYQLDSGQNTVLILTKKDLWF